MRLSRYLVFLFLILCVPLSVVGQSMNLRFSLPPVMGALPAAFAAAWGLFEAEGLSLETVGLSDDQARNMALLAGEIDGMVCDIPTAVLLAANGNGIVVTSTAYTPEQTESLAILSQSYFKIYSLDDLLRQTVSGNSLKSIAITSMSDTEFHIDALLRARGYDVEPDRDYSYWYDMLQVATFLSFGSVYAAVLPEPYVTYIESFPPLKQGSYLIHLSDFEGIDLLPSVIVFRRSVVDANPEAISAFYRGLQAGIDELNRIDRDVLIDTGIDIALDLFFPGSSRDTVPEGILDDFDIPFFQSPAPLGEQQFAEVVQWARGKNYIRSTPQYADVVSFAFCP